MLREGGISPNKGRAGFFRRSRQPFQILETAGDVPAFFPSRTGVSECSKCHVIVVERGHTLATHGAKKGGTFHALDDGESFVCFGLGEIATSQTVEPSDTVAQHLGGVSTARRGCIQIFRQNGIDRIRQFFVRVNHATHGHQCLAFGLAEGFQFNGPHSGWRQSGQHRACCQGTHQYAGTFEEFTSCQGQVLLGNDTAFFAITELGSNIRYGNGSHVVVSC